MAQQDSAKVEKDLPQFKTTGTKKKELKKIVQAEVKKIRNSIKTLSTEVDVFKGLNETDLGYLKSMEPSKYAQWKAKEKQLTLLKTRLAKIEKKYPDLSADPIGILD